MTNAATMEAKLLRLQDVEDIKTLRHKYADGQSGNLKSFAALFAKDGTFDVGMGIATGPAEIERMMRSTSFITITEIGISRHAVPAPRI
jgi:hypothetical protein